jgi:acetylornithine deacetylase
VESKDRQREHPLNAVVDHLSNLIRIPSISAISNRPVIDYAAAVLTKHGWSTHEVSYIDDSGADKLNLIAAPPGQPTAERTVDLAFLCHTDTVPYAKEWSEALQPMLRGQLLHGCGACDVKGFLACLLTAAASPNMQWRNGLRIILTADEEIGCIGSKHLISTAALTPKRLVIGEPTSLCVARAGKGYCLARVTIFGREAHSAFPAHGLSAIYAAAHLVSALEQLSHQLATELHSLFDPPFTSLNVGTIKGGSAKNIIPGRAELLVEWRPIPGASPGRIPAAIQQAMQQLRAQYSGLRCSLTLLRQEAGFETAADSYLVRTIEKETGLSATSIPFGSEASAWSGVAEELVVFGPGDMRTAHSDRECVPLHELTTGVRVLLALMQAAKTTGT